MARRGFLGRITDALRGLFGVPSPEEPPEPPPPPKPPEAPVPPGGGGGGGGGFDNAPWRIWQEEAKGRDRYDTGAFNQWWDLYQNATAPLQMSDAEENQFWDEFLRAFYLTSGEKGSLPRDRFYRNIGIRKRDFEMDWQEWREIKRGTP